MPSENKFIVLSSHCALKHLEEYCLFDIENDELYELSLDGFQFLERISRGENPSVREEDEEFIQFCLAEHLIALSDAPHPRKKQPHPSPQPSLRYLELQVTDRCNLKCQHCYLGDGHHRDLSILRIRNILEEFEEIQGLRLLLSGGEPLLHPQFWDLNDSLKEYGFRSVLLSNGMLITKDVARRLRVHEVQISLDGMKEGHESIRGKDTFEKALAAIDLLQGTGLRVSIATMIHRKNLNEFDQLNDLLQSKNIQEWNVDVPCIEGRLKENKALWLTPVEAGPYLNYGYGGGLHESKKNTTCGAHLCAILSDSKVCKCGLFSQESVGSIDEGLRTCWQKIKRIPLESLNCRCPEIETCRGGCRYRAQTSRGLLEPDLFQCYARGVLKGGEPNEHQESH